MRYLTKLKINSVSRVLLLALVPAAAGAQASADSFYIHKFQQRIGIERNSVTRANGAAHYYFDYAYVDRGTPVHLTADLQLAKDGSRTYRIKGGTSRFSTVNDSVHIRPGGGYADLSVNGRNSGSKLSAPAFPISGYAPATTQALLLQFWKATGRPATINTLPSGRVGVRFAGRDTVSFGGRPLLLERYVISGLIWGNELLWTDAGGNLICLITNDAEGDKQEIMHAAHEELLPALIGKAADYGMRLFSESNRPVAKSYPVIAIRGGRLADVESGNAIANSLVVIRGDQIVYAGPDDAKKIPAGAHLVNAKGMTVLPGLWDMHAHFQQAEWGPAYLASGITTVRDCGNEFDYINAVKSAIDKGVGVGPEIIKAGIIDGPGEYALGIVQASTPEEGRAAVRRYLANGYGQIKIYSSMTPAVVRAVCDEAHRRGVTVTGHIPEGMKLLEALDSGFDMVNHVQYLFDPLKRNADRTINFNDPESRALFTRLKAAGAVIDPTLSVYELAYRDLKEPVTSLEPAFATLPEPLKPLFRNTGVGDSASLAGGKRFMRNAEAIVKALHDSGIPIVAGSDMGMPGYSLLREIELYVNSGLSPMEALQTATIVPARVMKMDARTGSLRAGKSADILLVQGDATTDIRSIRNTMLVLRGGKLYTPADLRALAGFSKKK